MLGMEDTHKRSHIAVLVTSAIMFVVTAILTFISHGPLAAARQHVFSNNTLEVIASHRTSLTPPEWTYFTIWFLIFAWLLATYGYMFTTIFRFTSYGYLYIAPGHVTWNIYALLCLSMALNIVWLFVVDTGNTTWTFMLSLLTTSVLFVTMLIALRRMFARGLILQREEATREIWLCRMTLHNALDLYATWFLYLTLLSFDAVLVYGFGVADHLAGVGTIGFLLVTIVGFFCVDTFMLDKYSRYSFAGYIAFIIGLCGSVINNWNGFSSVTIISTIALITSCITFGLKIAITTIRHKREPIWTGSTMFLTNRSYGAVDERQKSGSHSQNLTYSSDLNLY